MNMIGNALLFLLLTITHSLHAAGAELRITARSGTQLSSVAVGTVCSVELTIPADTPLRGNISIEGIDRSEILGQQESMRTFVHNGVRTQERIIGCQVRFLTEGKRRIGPARVATDTGELVSNSLTLLVEQASQKTSGADEVKAQWQLPATDCYKGQGISYQLQFLYTNADIQNIHPLPIDIPDCRLEQQDAVAGITKIAGRTYHTMTWQGIIYPKKEGLFTVPAATISYQVPQHEAGGQPHWFSFISMFSGAQVEHATAPAVKLKIKPLPPHHAPVAGIGEIESVDLVVASATIVAGEPLVATLRIVGAVAQDSYQPPILQLPEDMQVYPSKAKYHEQAGSNVVQEYILQAHKDGPVTIPAQEITFFNPTLEKYQTHRTQPFELLVMPSNRVAENDDTLTLATTQSGVVQERLVAVAEPQQLLPLWLFLLLMVVPIVVRFAYSYVKNLLWGCVIYARQRWWLLSAKRSVGRAYEQHDNYKIYKVLYDVALKLTEKTTLTDDSALHFLRTRGLHEGEIERWKHLWEVFVAGAFGGTGSIDRALVAEFFVISNKLVSKPWQH